MYLSGGLLGPDGPASHGRRLAERLIDDRPKPAPDLAGGSARARTMGR